MDVDFGDQVAQTLAKCDKKEQAALMDKLETTITKLDQQIEMMCSARYQNFIECVQELLQVRPIAVKLKEKTTEIDSELRNSTETYIRKAEELIRARRILVNSTSSIELFKKCNILLEQYLKFDEQLQDKKYFPALKTLESLEREYLPTVSGYRFAQNMCKEIPRFRQIIKDAATKDLNDFLEGLLIRSQQIGECVFDSASDSSALGSVDFSPVYRGIHIYTTLGHRDEFVKYYRDQRQKQSRLAFTPPTNSVKNIQAYRNYFSSIIGFFVIEGHLIGTTNDMIESHYINQLWQSAVQSVTSSITQQTKLSRDASFIKDIGSLMALFTSNVRNYGLDTDALDELLVTIEERRTEALESMGPMSHLIRDLERQPDLELKISRKLNEKIDECLSLADYTWTITEASGQASNYISELIKWLKTSLTILVSKASQEVARGACLSACKHIANSLRDMLLSEDVKELSPGGLEQFNLDLMQCELFAGSEPVPGFKDGELMNVFAELRQLCDLFLYEEFSEFNSDFGKPNTKYSLVTAENALAMIDKVREYDEHHTQRNIFTLKRRDDKQKLRDYFSKMLRSKIQQQ